MLIFGKQALLVSVSYAEVRNDDSRASEKKNDQIEDDNIQTPC